MTIELLMLRQEAETLAELKLDDLAEEDWAELQRRLREALGWPVHV